MIPATNSDRASRMVRPALSAVLATLAALVCCTLAHAQVIDSTYILAVDRRVQEMDAVQGQEQSANAHRAFPFYPNREISCCR